MKQSHRHYEFGTFSERLEHICLLLEVDPPEIVYEDGHPTLAEPVMDWIKANEVDMDWLFAGSPSGILQNSVNSRRRSTQFAEINQQMEPQVQAGFLALLTAVVKYDLPLEEPLQIFGKVVKDWRELEGSTRETS
ncbi:hypothetical protein [uncultured Ruegeria sp.]|uniref:hypothetical protein n=1 Tax=uncultured Ruegeria sp. TaxID=259304 RepID=UPI00262A261A|nr:hypothetical protein [uncultured Ruegeria sp.]